MLADRADRARDPGDAAGRDRRPVDGADRMVRARGGQGGGAARRHTGRARARVGGDADDARSGHGRPLGVARAGGGGRAAGRRATPPIPSSSAGARSGCCRCTPSRPRPTPEWAARTVAECMVPAASVPHLAPGTPASDAVEVLAGGASGRAVVVDGDGRLVGHPVAHGHRPRAGGGPGRLALAGRARGAAAGLQEAVHPARDLEAAAPAALRHHGDGHPAAEPASTLDDVARTARSPPSR